jgi:hypothetical protein
MEPLPAGKANEVRCHLTQRRRTVVIPEHISRRMEPAAVTCGASPRGQ